MFHICILSSKDEKAENQVILQITEVKYHKSQQTIDDIPVPLSYSISVTPVIVI